MVVFSFQTNFFLVMLLYLIYSLLTTPTFSLVNTVTFHHYYDTREKYGNIRLWGTVSWIMVGWFFSYFWLKLGNGNISGSLIFSAIFSALTGLYCLTIPKPKAIIAKPASFLPIESMKVFFKSRILTVTIFVCIVSLLDKFYIVGISPFLKQSGFPEYAIMPAMTLGQISEIIIMTLLAVFIKKIGFKKVFMIGIFFEIIRYTVFSLTSNPVFIIPALFVHGITYAFIYVPMLIYLDTHCEKINRAGVLQLNNIFVTGLSGFLGNVLSGFVGTLFTFPETDKINYFYYWAVPLVLSIIGMIYVSLSIKNVKKVIHQNT